MTISALNFSFLNPHLVTDALMPPWCEVHWPNSRELESGWASIKTISPLQNWAKTLLASLSIPAIVIMTACHGRNRMSFLSSMTRTKVTCRKPFDTWKSWNKTSKDLYWRWSQRPAAGCVVERVGPYSRQNEMTLHHLFVWLVIEGVGGGGPERFVSLFSSFRSCCSSFSLYVCPSLSHPSILANELWYG